MNIPQKLNFKAKTIVFSCLLFAFGQAVADHAITLYKVDVLVADESADTRWRAFKEGLDEVFIRISGDSIVMDKLKRPAASRHIKQYSYDPVAKPVTNAQGETLNYRLKIQYNGSSMEKYLLDNGFPVWGEHRSDLVLWLAVRDGRNEYVLKSADNSLIKATADDALERRGIPDRWPLYDYKDKKILTIADIRGGFQDPVAKASTRYGSGPALTGSLIWNGKLWQSSWSLLMAGKNSNKHWSIEDADYDRLINKAVDQAADAMGLVFAVHNIDKNRQLAAVHIEVQAVSSIEKYRRVEDYLSDLRAVETVVPLAVDGQNAIFKVMLLSTESDFLNLIKNDAELVEAEAIKPEVDTLEIAQDNMQISPEALPPVEQKNPSAGSDTAAVLPGDTTVSNNTASDNIAPMVDPIKEEKDQIAVYHYKLTK